MKSNEQELTDDSNKVFWDELCGSSLARSIGITDHSINSLKRFDQAYLDYYPYLLKHINPQRMKGKKVLEIGLGYGTVGQRIAEERADYLGIDIASTPVEMIKHRFEIMRLQLNAFQANFLENELEANRFDYVISIGCFHHTGDIPKCVDETYRILKPGGMAIIMVYNQFSARQWFRWPIKTFRALFQENDESSINQRSAYDTNIEGSVAPVTDFSSIRYLRKLFGQFSNVNFTKENFNNVRVLGRQIISRKGLLSWPAHLLGLDIYIEAQK